MRLVTLISIPLYCEVREFSLVRTAEKRESGRGAEKKNPGCAGSAITGAELTSRSPNSPEQNCPMYWISPARVLENSCWMLALNICISGFLRLAEMGRTRPQLGGQAGPINSAGFGKLGNAASTNGLVVVCVRRFLPSKFRESRTTLLKANTVTSAPDALNSVPGRISHVKPRRGCQLFLSEEQAGMTPLPSKHVPLGPLTVPPLKAPAS